MAVNQVIELFFAEISLLLDIARWQTNQDTSLWQIKFAVN